MNKICQSCGMYIDDGLRGTNADQTLNGDYCIYCYQNGSFLYDDTMEEKIEKCVPLTQTFLSIVFLAYKINKARRAEYEI